MKGKWAERLWFLFFLAATITPIYVVPQFKPLLSSDFTIWGMIIPAVILIYTQGEPLNAFQRMLSIIGLTIAMVSSVFLMVTFTSALETAKPRPPAFVLIIIGIFAGLFMVSMRRALQITRSPVEPPSPS
ncbi:MAG: hypothetical protein HYT22_01605 [Candidatus Niyogibacteria bacterium]|nr:hypothetical protein [Candidatus Niyogibacteria bacterium]